MDRCDSVRLPIGHAELAIVLPDHHEVADGLVAVSMLIIITGSALAFAFAFAFAGHFTTRKSNDARAV